MELELFIDVDAFTVEITEDIDDITKAMSTQTARAAHYSMQSTKAKRQKDKVGLIVKTVEAQLTKTMRTQLKAAADELAEDEGGKPERITTDMVKAEVQLNATMRMWLEKQIDADEIYAVCKAAYDAFYTRREMITSLGHMTRAQMQTGIVVQTAKAAVGGYEARRAEREKERKAAAEG